MPPQPERATALIRWPPQTRVRYADRDRSMTLTGQIAVFLGATVLTVPLFRRLRLSSILAHLAAGVLIGPFGLAVINDTEGVMHIAEFGVVLLLFVIGLEL